MANLRWISAIWYDLTGQEHKQKLTREEKINYSLYASCVFWAIAICGLFVENVYIGITIVIVCTAIATRKLCIYWNKRDQWEKEKELYKLDE